jgi:hypothetical protein
LRQIEPNLWELLRPQPLVADQFLPEYVYADTASCRLLLLFCAGLFPAASFLKASKLPVFFCCYRLFYLAEPKESLVSDGKASLASDVASFRGP